MSTPFSKPGPRHVALTLTHLQRIRKRLLQEHSSHRIEYGLWEVVLTLWIMGWIGLLPAYALDLPWAFPLCAFGMLAPRLYVMGRARAHDSGRLRCDWLDQLR